MRLLNADSVQFLRGIVKMRPVKNVENLMYAKEFGGRIRDLRKSKGLHRNS